MKRLSLAIVVTALLAACGSNGSDSSPGAAEPAVESQETAQPALEGEEVADPEAQAEPEAQPEPEIDCSQPEPPAPRCPPQSSAACASAWEPTLAWRRACAPIPPG